MKKITDMFGLGLVVLAVVTGGAGCSPKTPKTAKADAAVLQGTWKGQEAAGNAAGSDSLVLSGTTLEFHGANPQEWYKATYTLRDDKNPKQLVATITECADPRYVGKTANAIYQIQDGTFTLAAFEPGNPTAPASFDDPNARKIVFKQ